MQLFTINYVDLQQIILLLVREVAKQDVSFTQKKRLPCHSQSRFLMKIMRQNHKREKSRTFTTTHDNCLIYNIFHNHAGLEGLS